MSSPPQPLRLSGDYSRDVKALSDAHDAIEKNLNRGIELRNLKAVPIDYEFRAPLTEAPRIRTKLSASPDAVVLRGMWRTSPRFEPVGIASTPMWFFDGGDLVLPWLEGITGNDLYLVKLLVWEA